MTRVYAMGLMRWCLLDEGMLQRDWVNDLGDTAAGFMLEQEYGIREPGPLRPECAHLLCEQIVAMTVARDAARRGRSGEMLDWVLDLNVLTRRMVSVSVEPETASSWSVMTSMLAVVTQDVASVLDFDALLERPRGRPRRSGIPGTYVNNTDISGEPA